jgi:hypothetical protein
MLTQKIDKVILLIAFFYFALLFYAAKQYVASLLSLALIIIFIRITDLKTFSINQKGILAEFREKDESISEIIKSDQSIEDKVDQSQKLIDEVFKLGYIAGGGKRFANITDVKVERDENGNIIHYEYSEN